MGVAVAVGVAVGVAAGVLVGVVPAGVTIVIGILSLEHDIVNTQDKTSKRVEYIISVVPPGVMLLCPATDSTKSSKQCSHRLQRRGTPYQKRWRSCLSSCRMVYLYTAWPHKQTTGPYQISSTQARGTNLAQQQHAMKHDIRGFA